MSQPNVCPLDSTWEELTPQNLSDLIDYNYPSSYVEMGNSFSGVIDLNVSECGAESNTLYPFLRCLGYNLGISVLIDTPKFSASVGYVLKLNGTSLSTPLRTTYNGFGTTDKFKMKLEYNGIITSNTGGVATYTASAKLTITEILTDIVIDVLELDDIANCTTEHTMYNTIDMSSIINPSVNRYSNIVGQGLPNECLPPAKYIGEYSVELKLAMTIRENFNGRNTITDWGSSADLYTFDGDLITDNYNIWERLSSNAPSVKLNDEGFYPFGTHFLGDVTGKRYPLYKEKANFHGAFQSWGGKMIPDSSGGYSYDTTAWSPSNVTGFGIAGLENFPMPTCTSSSEYSVSYNRAGNVIREYDSGEYSERRQFSIKWSNMCGDALRSILVQILTVIRGNTFTIDFGDNLMRLSPWLPRSGEVLSGVYDIRLSSPVIKYNYVGGGMWELTIEVIKWDQ